MRARPVTEFGLEHPGWQITDWRGYEYVVWAPSPASADDDTWQAQWRNAESDDGSTVVDADVEGILAIFPIRVAVEFRRVISEHLFTARTRRVVS